MAATVFSGILLVLGIGGFLVAHFVVPKIRTVTSSSYDRYGNKQSSSDSTQKNYWRTGIKIAAAALVPIAVAIFIGSGFQSVPTKSVGVLTSFGQVQGTPYGPGSHWMMPWKTLNVVTDTIQSDSFFQANGNGSDSYSNSGARGYCISIRLGGQQEGCADVQLQTQTNESAIPELFANYNSYGPNLTQDVDQFVVKRDLTTILNRDMGDYNPIEDVSLQLEACDLKNAANCQTNVTSQFSKFDGELTKDLQAELGDQVHVFDVNLQYVHYDAQTENALISIQNSYTDTAKAVQQEQTNAAISAANKALVSQTGTLTTIQLQQECYSIVQQAIKAGYSLPATWGNCASGSSSSPPVILNTGK